MRALSKVARFADRFDAPLAVGLLFAALFGGCWIGQGFGVWGL